MMVEDLDDFIEAADLYGTPPPNEWERWVGALFPGRGAGMGEQARTVLRAITEDIACGSVEDSAYYQDLAGATNWQWPRMLRRETGVTFREARSRIRLALARWLSIDREYPITAALRAVGYGVLSGRAATLAHRAPYAQPPARIQRWLPT